MTPDNRPFRRHSRVRRLLTGWSEVIHTVLRPSFFLLCLWLAHATAAEAAPNRTAAIDERAAAIGATESGVLPSALPEPSPHYSSDASAADLRKPAGNARESSGTSLPEPAVLVLLGIALLTASFAARRLQGRGFRVRLETSVMGQEWVAAREAENAAVARWTEIWQISARRAVKPMTKVTPLPFPRRTTEVRHSAVRH